jgi:AcrR family transcriptional regulator
MATARGLFAERGYAAVSADDIVSAAGLTRGALHHHFGDKVGLFRAVFEQLEVEMTAELTRAMAAVAAAGDTATRMAVGLGGFLDICQRPEVLRIALTDAPTVLGWETWRAIEAEHGLGLIKSLIEQGVAEGMIIEQPPDVLAQLVLGVTIEAALLIANGADREAVQSTLLMMLSGLMRLSSTQTGGVDGST